MPLPKYWIDRDAVRHKVSDMSDTYIKNCIATLEEGLKYGGVPYFLEQYALFKGRTRKWAQKEYRTWGIRRIKSLQSIQRFRQRNQNAIY